MSENTGATIHRHGNLSPYSTRNTAKHFSDMVPRYELKMREFRNGIRERTPRISNEEWERWKPVIVEKYQSSTIDEVREYMESEHKFVAT